MISIIRLINGLLLFLFLCLISSILCHFMGIDKHISLTQHSHIHINLASQNWTNFCIFALQFVRFTFLGKENSSIDFNAFALCHLN